MANIEQIQKISDEVKAFIVENFLFTSDRDVIQSNASFQELGIVDSTGVLEIVAFLENKFGITVQDDEVVPDNLDSIDKIISYIARKIGG